MGIETTTTHDLGTAGAAAPTPGVVHRATDGAVQRIADVSIRVLFRVNRVRC